MIRLRPGAGIGPLLCLLRGHAEAVAFEAVQDPALGAELLERCFGAGGRGFSYDREKRGRDDWYGIGPALRELVCTKWQLQLAGRTTGPVCIDCEDQAAYYSAAALVSRCYGWVEVGIVPPPSKGADGHAVLRVGPLVASAPPGLQMPASGLWDPAAWSGMRAPDPVFYDTAQYLRLRDPGS
jgi:hypothetical protein